MMNINVMRAVDKYIGIVICFTLLTLQFIFKCFRRSKLALQRKDIKKILLIKFFGMGSIILASPAIRKLKETYPDAKISILTLYGNKDICQMLLSIDNAIYLRIDNPLAFLFSFLRIIFLVRKKNYDVIMNLEFFTNFSAMVTLFTILFTTKKIAIGFNSPLRWRNSVHNINVSFDHSRHITKIFAKMVHSIGVETFQPSLKPEKEILLKKMDTEYMQNLLKSNVDLASCNFFICVNINAGNLCLHRSWPKEYFATVVNELIKRSNVAILLIGAKQDMKDVSEFRKNLTPSARIVDVSGKTNIKELIGLFSSCDLLITNDSGPLHLAQISGLPTISFFGPETPYLYGPLDTNKHYVFYEDLYCSPCLNIYNSKESHCRDNICLKAIKPQRVLKVIAERYLFAKNNFLEKSLEEQIDEVPNI